MTRTDSSRTITIANLEPGDHLCCLYETEEEHRAVLTPFLRQGLERGEKVLYIVDADELEQFATADVILGYLRDDGLDVEFYLARGQLVILTSDDAYVREGVFDPDGMIALLRAETDQALAEGYSALRVAGEMTWASAGLPGFERLIEYEAKLNEFLPGSKCTGLCQHDQRRFDPAVLLDVLHTHPIAIVGTEVYDNFYIPPDELLSGDLPTAKLRHWLGSLAERKRAEEALQQRGAVLGAIALAAEKFLRPGDWEQDIQAGLAYLGKAADVSRVLIWEGSTSDDGEHLISVRYEWIAPEATLAPLVGIQNIPMFRRWQDLLPRGEIITGHVRDLSAKEQEFFVPREIKSVLAVPIFVSGAWWGFMGFDQGVTEREWTEAEIDALKTAASILGGTLERKRAEETLQESEERFRMVLESSMDNLYRRNLKTDTYDYMSPAVEHISGYSVEEILSMPLESVVSTMHPDDIDRVKRGIEESMTSDRAAYLLEYRFRHKDGQYRWLSDLFTVVRDAQGRLLYFIGSVRDITERKRAEEALQESEERYRAIFEQAADSIVLVDVETGALAEFNDRAHENLGYTREEFEKLKIPDFEVIESAEEVAKHFEKVIKEGANTFETKHKTKGGEIRNIQVSARAISIRGKDFIQGIWRDITERKRAEEALRRRNRGLALLNQASQAFSSTLDPDRVLVTVLEEVRRLLNVLACSAWLLDSETGELVCRQATGSQSESVRGWRLAPGEGLAGSVLRSGESLIVPDALADERYFADVAQQTGLSLRSILTVPLRVKENVIGVLQAVDTEVGRFGMEDLALLEPLAASAAVAIENALLYQLAQQEVTERRRAQEALRESEERYRHIFEQSPVGIGLASLDGKVLAASKAMETITGYSVEELTKIDLSDTYESEEDRERLLEAIRRHGSVADWPVRLRRKDGTLYDALLNIALINLGGKDYLHTICQDITKRKEAEETLKHRMKQLTALSQAAQAVTASLELDQVLTEVVSLASQVAASDYAGVILVDEAGQPGRSTEDMPDIPTLTYRIRDEGLTSWIVRSCQPTIGEVGKHGVISPPLDEGGPRFANPHIVEAGIRSFAGLPMIVKDRLLGVLYLHSLRPGAFRGQLPLLTTFANQAAIAIENARLFEQVRVGRERLQVLSRQLVEAQETERRRIARELHDEIGQVLTVAKINLQALQHLLDAPAFEPHVLEQHIEESIGAVGRTLQQVRDLSLDLRPSLLDDLGLVPALRWYVDRQAQQAGFPVQFAADPVLEKRLPPDLEIVGFRIAQEALTNIVRHAQAQWASVELRHREQELQLAIRDDGVGFDVERALERAARGESLGLLGMQERVQLVGGHIEIESVPARGYGTEIRARFPLTSSQSLEE